MSPKRSSPRAADGISRREFLNGVLLSAGGATIGAAGLGCDRDAPSVPGPPPGAYGSRLDSDPRALRGGNLPATFDVAHLLRDNRLAITANSLTVAGSTRDTLNGSFVLLEDHGLYEVIIVGSGISGLSAAFFLMRRRPGTRILVLDVNPAFGGNAGRDDAPPLPAIAATGAAYAVSPSNDMLKELYGTIGIDWDAHAVAGPLYCYYFDERTPFVLPGWRGWVLDAYGKGMDHMPYPPQVLADLKKSRQDMLDWLEQDDGPTDPADESHPRYDDLAEITLDDYLRKKRGYHEAVSDFYTRYTVDALGGTAKQVSAYSGISFLQGEYSPSLRCLVATRASPGT
jgi:spermidine dehydrogenase